MKTKNKIENYPLEQLVTPALDWYEKNKRSLPWRGTKDPYKIWISEIMLQQTRVEAVKGYYQRFLEALPDIPALSACPDEALLKLWEGLGYYTRARNLKKAAVCIMETHGGVFPRDHSEVLSLPGVGPYTAGAICSIAYGLPVPAVDGNVFRILTRVCEDDSDILKASTRKRVEEALKKVMPEGASGEFNQAMMEIGACACLPNGAPLCESEAGKCPWAIFCLAHKNHTWQDFPVKKKPAPRKIVERTILLVTDEENEEKIWLKQRPDNGLLAGLYEFPGIEGHAEEEELRAYLQEQNLQPLEIHVLPKAKHIFSHIEWRMTGYLIKVRQFEGNPRAAELPEGFFVTKKELKEEYALPSAFSKYVPYVL